MRSPSGPASSSRCQTGSAPQAGISSMNPSRRSLPTAFLAAPPLRSDASSIASSGCRAAADSSTSCVSVSLLLTWSDPPSVGDGVLRRHHRSPAVATKPAGQGSEEGPMAFDVAATVTLCSDRNASLFWIILWLVSGPADNGMILGCSRSFWHSRRQASVWRYVELSEKSPVGRCRPTGNFDYQIDSCYEFPGQPPRPVSAGRFPGVDEPATFPALTRATPSLWRGLPPAAGRNSG